MSLLGFLRGGPGGAIAGATVGAVDPSLPNAMKYGAQAAQGRAPSILATVSAWWSLRGTAYVAREPARGG
jgi:hypothetical protein